MKTIKQLEAEKGKIQSQINELEEAEIEKIQKPRLRAMVGQCFAYRKNSYSLPQEQSDYWDVFKKIIDYVDTKERGFNFICEEFSIDRDGKISLEINSHAPYLNKEWWDVDVPFSGYEKITETEYQTERAKLFEEITTQKKLRKILQTNYDF